MEHNIKLTLKEVIAIIKDKYLSEGEKAIFADSEWTLYHNEADSLQLETVCCITEIPEFDEETDEEILPPFAAKNGMEFPILAEEIQDVVTYVVDYKIDEFYEKVIEVLNYYLENDNFMDL